jgi:hypothetical protein
MRFVFKVKSTAHSEAGDLPPEDLMGTITQYHEQLADMRQLYVPEDFAPAPGRRAASCAQADSNK